jgi:hypothetical protein
LNIEPKELVKLEKPDELVELGELVVVGVLVTGLNSMRSEPIFDVFSFSHHVSVREHGSCLRAEGQ